MRVSQLTGELVSAGSEDVRVSQALAELVTAGSEDIRLSQFLVEVIHDGIPGASAHPRAWVFVGALAGNGVFVG